jgi:hypothetical protein
VPPDSVRCTTGHCPLHQGTRLQTCHLREFWGPFRYNSSDCLVHHRTIQCASGATATSRQQSSAEGIKCATVRGCTRRSQSTRQTAHRTVYHWTVRWARRQKLQRSNPNGRVTWLAHRIVSSGAPDCPVRHATTASIKRLVWWLGL